ncbi:MAG: hypothetical protein GXY60_11450 [Spirochaetales bacterium]|jgi:hypothetical protein|nr:hypothetical protein [Spirochaetales bacterium]
MRKRSVRSVSSDGYRDVFGYYQGIAVANAFQEVRQAASCHTLSYDEDGVAQRLKMQFLSS